MKNIVVIGSTGLCVNILEQFKQEDFLILGTVAQDDLVKEFCELNNIKTFTDITKINEIEQEYYLFSVINSQLIPSKLLSSSKLKCAINYHDSYLPSYAGINSTVWAILNKEYFHGVTWHKIDTGIDTGDILYQEKISISEKDTTLSLNIKCTEVALNLFTKIIQDLRNNDLKYSTQIGSIKRSYFGRNYVPDNYAILGQESDFNKYLRALNFGKEYVNPVATPKVFIKNNYYIVKEAGKDNLVVSNIFGRGNFIYNIEDVDNKNISTEELNFIKKIKAKEIFSVNNLKKISSMVVEQDHTNIERVFNSIIISSKKDIDKECLIDAISLFVKKYLINSFDGIDLYREVTESELCYERSFIDLNNVLEISPIVITKDFEYRYKLLSDSKIAIYLYDETAEGHYDITFRLIKNNKIVIKCVEHNQPICSSLSKFLQNVFANKINIQNIPNKKGIEVSLLTDNEYQTIIYDWNKTDKAFPKDRTIYQLFEDQVDKNPNNIALVYEGQELTYKKLNERSNQLARYIRKQYKLIIGQELKPDTLIPLCLERSLDMVIGILAVMKAGGTYVPMDPEYPQERFKHILEDTDARLVIIQSHLEDKLKQITDELSKEIDFISINSNIQFGEEIYVYGQENKLNLDPQSRSTDLAYVIYTSGTTGVPKGVMIEHKSLVNRILWGHGFFNFNKTSRVLARSPFIFDASIGELIGTILSGAQLFIYPKNKDLNNLLSYIKNNNISVVTLTPEILNYISTNENFSQMSFKILCGGGILSQKTLSICENKSLYNCYGPSETTIDFSVSNECNRSQSISIGKPIYNLKSYILDKYNQPVPIGVVGELYIGGAGLARGYLNRPELTVERFVSNPFATESDIEKGYTRLYKTGDLVRWLPDGNIEYIGRNDFQVKIRGYRIELGEIESQLSKLEGIKQSVVLAQTNLQTASQYLVGYYVPDELGIFKQEHLLDQLSQILPDYMVPSVLVELDSMPLTVNGKLDRKALPDSEFVSEDSYLAPSTKLEVSLCNLFAEVLGLEKVGIKDDFFRIGGNSILAIKLANRISKELEVNISVVDIFSYKNVSKLSDYLLDSTIDNIVIPKLDLNKYSLSFAQERLWFIEQYEKGSNAYHIPMLVCIKEGIDIDAIKQSIRSIVDRHEVLRSVFKQDDNGEDYQEVLDKELVINQYSYKNSDITKQIDLDINTPFDLRLDYPIRISVYKEELETKLLINIHHIASDGWSIDIILKELNAYYDHYANNRQLQLSDLSIQYKDFAVWQREYLQGEELEKQLGYWRNRLQGYETLNLATDYSRPSQIDYNGDNISFDIEEDISNKLRLIAKENNTSLYSLLLSVFYVLLHKYTSQEDIVVGTPIANRHYNQTQGLIGFFVNSLALRERLDTNLTLIDLVKDVHKNLIEAQSHQDLPFEKLVSALEIEQDQSRHPIFQVIFGLQGFGSQPNSLFKSVTDDIDYKIAKFDLECFIDDSQDKLRGRFNYATALYTRETIERLVESYQSILNQLVGNQETRIKEYSLLSDEEYQRLVYDWNQTDKSYPKDKTVYQLFEEQVEANSNNVALVYEDQELTYRELNERSNQLARYIRKQYKQITNEELSPDTLIPLCLERSLDMVIGILAVMKSGGAYVPMDPDYPTERFKHILTDTEAKLVITQNHLEHRLKEVSDIETISIDRGIYQDEETTYLQSYSQSTDLAYVIYTSGTTGVPKGVMVEYTSVINTLNNLLHIYDVKQDDNVSAFTSYVFDVSVSEIFISLLQGSILHIFSDEIKKDIGELSVYISDKEVNYLYLPPVLLSQLPQINYPSLKKIIYAGESCSKEIARYWSSQLILHNIYGPTETTIYSVEKQILNDEVTQIGKPLSNEQTYILDQDMTPVPIGVIGELYIGGAGLARGYLNRAELTAERFVSNPFATENDIEKGYTRLYKTGDLVRWLPDGNIEYIGRNDFQVKIRGYRIELGEIENQLSLIEGIKQSCVLATTSTSSGQINSDNGTKYLVGYYVSDKGILEEEVLKQLSTVLPDYMLPSILVKLDSMPLTVNSKLDRRALPKPEFVNKDTYVAPTSELEISICNIFAEVLGLEKVGLTDNFFRIGGDSILSIQLSSKLRKSGYECSVRDIFDNRNVLKLVEYIESNIDNDVDVIKEEGLLTGSIRLLPIQEWFFDKIHNNEFVDYNHWNQSFMVKIPELDISRLSSILVKLVEHHDILRVSYDVSANTQEYNQSIVIPEIEYIDINNYSSEELHIELTKLQSNFDIEQGALFKVGYISGYTDGSARIFFALHHLIVDAVSWRILIDDFKSLYNNQELSAKATSYRQYVDIVRDYSNVNKEQLGYWSNIVKDLPDYKVTKEQPTRSVAKLDEQATTSLLQVSNKAYNTEINDLLLTSLLLSLKDINGLNIQGITLEGHGREYLLEGQDIGNTVGWFTTMYPVLLEDKEDLDVTIRNVKESLRLIPDKGIGFGSFAVQKENNITFKDLPAISFNYLGQFDSKERMWQVVSESSGDSVSFKNKDHNIININGMVVDGQLSFSVVTQLGQTITDRLSKSLEQRLKEVQEYTSRLVDKGISYRTPSDYNSEISIELLDKLQLEDNEIEYIYPANSLQQGFIYHMLSNPSDDAYRVQLIFDYEEELDIDNYIKAWELSIEKHPILRTAFNWQEEILQIVYAKGDIEYCIHDISQIDNKDKAIKDIQVKDRQQGFDLSKPTQLRLHIVKQSKDLYTVIKSEHHSIIDGWSSPILLNDVHSNYYELGLNRVPSIQIDNSYLRVQDYIQKYKDQANKYWQEELQEVEVNDLSVLLTTEKNINEIKSLDNNYTQTLIIDGDIYNKIKNITLSLGITTNTLLQFVWHKLINIYTQDQQTIIGTTISGRELSVESIEDSVGLYINTLPLIADWDNGNTIKEQLKYLHNQIADLSRYSYADLSKIQGSRDRLFHSIFVFENYPVPEVNQEVDKNILNPEFRYAVEKLDYPLGIVAYEHNNDLHMGLKSSEEVLRRETAQSYLEKLNYILEQLLQDIDQKHNKLTTLTKEEYQTIVYAWNQTDKAYPKDKTIYQLFEEQVEKNPNNIALVYEDQELTYKELNERSNQLARYIRKQYERVTNKELKSDTLIPLCLERSLDMVIGILGVMKAGGAYIPMDPDYPIDRFKHILSDTNAKLVITQSNLECKFTELKTELGEDIDLILIDSISTQTEVETYIYGQEDEVNLEPQSKSTDLAYVIYTSGTTGLPKGVMLSYDNLNNLIFNQINAFNISQDSKVLQFASYIFDASVWEIFSSLTIGSELYVASNAMRINTDIFLKYIELNRISVVPTIPPILLSTLIYKELPCLKTLVIGGEACSKEVIDKWSQGRLFINAYGPTESTVCATLHKYNKGDLNTNIGKPLNNTKLYILDQYNQPVPVGVVGELYIGGAGLARGYLNRRELTAERFVPNPFANESDIANGYTRLYKTGDLVRWLPDGNIEYIGRNDFQVKIHGFRIELGEIESQLSKLDGIKQSIVLAKEKAETKSQYLVGYYVADELGILKQEELLDQLSEVLPEYMVPSVLVELESLPLTVNGKLDRKALPNPEFVSDDTYQAPTTELEISICNIFAEVLGLARVGVTEDFFRIGGDSIVSIQLSSRLRRTGIDCSVRDIFDYRTVSKLAKYLSSKEEIESKIIQEHGVLEGEFDLLPIQEWFFDRVNSGEFKAYNHWNQSFLVKVPELDVSRLNVIVEKLVLQHDILRVNYVKQGVGYTQVYRSSIDIPGLKLLDVSKLSQETISKELTNWQSDFDIEHGPLWSIGYLYGFKDGSARIYFALHHLIVDAVSWRILIDDFKSLYNNEELSDKGTSYRQYIDLVKDYANNNKDQLGYWSNVLANIPSYPEVNSKPSLGEVHLNKSQTESLLQHGNKAYHTEINDLLLTALALSLKDINQSDIQAITLEGHGREHIQEGVELNHTVGWFTTMYPALLEVKEDLDSTIKYIKESLRSIPDKGIGFGSFAQSSDEIDFKQLPRISFNYLGQFDGKEGLWQLVSEDSGIGFNQDNRDHNIININGMVVDGQLSFRVVTQLGKKITDELSKSFQESLIQIQEHTQSLVDRGKEYYTPSDYGSSISIGLYERLQIQAKELDSRVEAIYPANSLQQGFIYHVLSNPKDDAYRVQLLFDYKQDLNVDNYVKAWELAIQKYPILRTAFNWEEDIIQTVYSKGDLEYHLHDISNQDDKEEVIKDLQLRDRQQGFDLSKPTQLRLHIIKQTDDHYTIIKSEHHVISDGWSGPILLNQVHEYYKELCQGKQINAIEDDSYLRAQGYIQANQLKVKAYWDNQLQEVTTNDLNPLLSSKHDLNEVRSLDSHYDEVIAIKGELYSRLKRLTKELGITINTLVQFVWHKLIQVYTQDSQTIVGTTISGRDIPIEGIESSVGLYINTLPLVVNWDNDNTIREQLEYIHRQITDLSNNSYVSLSQLQEQGQRLFHSLLVYENYPVSEVSNDNSNHTLQAEFKEAIEKLDYPIGVIAYEHSNQLKISIKTTEDLITKGKTIEYLSRLQLLLEQSVNNLDKAQRELTTLTEQERNQIVYAWNETDKAYPSNKTIYQLFEEQVEANPNNIVLVFSPDHLSSGSGKEQKLTYKQLNERSNQLARYIRKQYNQITNQELTPDTLIPLSLERSLDMVIGILAVIKSGGAYVPMGPEYPAERFKHILIDTNAKLIITQSHLEGKLKQIVQELDKDIDLISINSIIDDQTQEEVYIYDQEDKANLSPQSKATDLAYVIYTSGTTGLPKGVLQTHSNVHRLLSATDHQFEFSSKDVWTLYHSYIFDFTVWELWGSLAYGGRLIIPSEQLVKDISNFIDLCLEYKVTVLNQTPSAFYTFVDQLANREDIDLSSLRYVIFGGDALNINLLNKWWNYKKVQDLQTKLINMYGITETTVHVTYKEIDENEEISSNIGKSIDALKAYILDQHQQPIPIGVIGELYIGGAGLARGYLNRAELTAERFVFNPFASESDIANGYTRLYKTGDLVRWLPDGNIEYIGRNDFQVKIRGYRIELGEIESQLANLEGIKQSVVLARTNEETNNQYLVGYYVPKKLEVLKQEDLLGELSKVLSDYMIPSVLVELESFPLTDNGKLNRKALPKPEFVNKDTYVAPTNELESKACMIFAEVLGLDISEISTSANFFRIGANSILSIKLKQKLNQIKEFKEITVADIFTYNTVKALANKVISTDSNYNLPSLASTQSHEIAIIGTSGIFTGNNTVKHLWRLLESNSEAIEFLSIDKCRELGVLEDLLSDTNYVPVSGRVKDIDLFNPSFWGMSPNEAKQLDPQIRKFIEHCWYVLEQSGYSQSRKQDIIGVFAGMGSDNYFNDHILNGELKDEINLWEAGASNSKDALATKVAYSLGLTGPAHSVNTACSTGLVSIVDACRNLSLNTCNTALAGGVSLSLPDEVGYIYQEGMIASQDGHCRTFDANANGTTRGSGVGVILLKRLGDAIRDKDNILGVIKGYATNNDGDRKSGYTAPSVVGQSECIISAQKMAGIDVNDIDYVECHGTATKLGDPIEVQALQEAFKHNGYINKDKKVILGAIKANIGHTDSAAGTAGLIKVTEMFRNDLIPGQPNFKKPNPELNIESTPFEIAKANSPWLSNRDKPRLAGVSSFGVGGTNAHVIVSDYYQKAKQVITEDNQEYIIPITAKSRKSLLDYQKSLVGYLESNDLSLRDLVYTLTYRREHFNYRASFVVNSKEELIKQLNTKTSYTEIPQEESNTIVFMFPGQGNQYLGMAKELYENDKKFQEIVDKTTEIANRYLEEDLKDILFNKTSEQINQTEWSQICLFVIEYSLAKYLNTLNIRAGAYMGHSIGEYVAATLAGVFKLEDAIKLVIARGRCMQAMPKGSMLSINAEQEDVESYIQQSNCEIAVINSIEDIVASGKDEDIDNLHNLLKHKAIPSIKLNTSHAYHSRLMEEASISFKKAFEGIQINKPKQTTISNVTGEISKEEITNPEYWQQQIRSTVEFAKGIETLSNKYSNRVTFIEVGPGKSSTSFVEKYKKHINSKTIHTVQILPSQKQRAEWDIRSQQNIEAILWQNGLKKQINEQTKQDSNLLTNLPAYQFEFQSCWVNKLPRTISQDELSILPENKWYSTTKWTLEEDIKNNDAFKLPNSLIFIYDDTEKLLFKNTASDALFVKLDLSVKDFVNNDNQITINPVIESHYKELSNHIGTIKNIIHIASHKDKVILEDNLSYGFYSLFLIKKYLLSAKSFERLLVLTSGLFSLTDSDYISASNGSMVGAIRNINHENLDLNSQIIDIGDSENISGILSTLSKEAYSKSESPIAIRFNKLWQERIANITLENNEQSTIKDKDTIFVTGGLGGVALSTALEISKHHNDIHFILSSRTDITKQEITEYIQEKLDILEQIKTNNCSFEILAIDISDEIFVKKLKSKNIQGIIHTAGVEPLTLDKNSLGDIRTALKAKVYGIENILNVIDISKLSFIAITSSLASIMGDVNRFEYCASNSYLDYLSKDNRFKNTKIVSVNWPGWSDIGMVRNDQSIENNSFSKLQKLMYDNSFKAVDGAQVFYTLINSNLPQVILSKLDTNKLIGKLFKKESLNNTTMATDEVKIVEKDYTDQEYKVAQIFGKVLGVNKISLYDDFFTLGGNSILAIKLINIIVKEIKVSMSVADIYSYRNIMTLIKNIKETSIIKPFYDYYNDELPDMLLIHPGSGGCEVYNSLANKLVNKYNCIGIDNYNISSKTKIAYLYELADLYLNLYIKNFRIKTNKPIYLLGWSLGGKIALEIALLLELKGLTLINVVLLDTIINDITIENFVSQINNTKIKDQMKKNMLKKYQINYINKIIDTYKTESILSKETLSGKLRISNVILFKALQEDISFNDEVSIKLNRYILGLKDNNIGIFVKKLKVINIECNHGNILSDSGRIVNNKEFNFPS